MLTFSCFIFSALEAMLQNGGDPFLKNKNGDSIETYLQNREDLLNLKELVNQARINKNLDNTEENYYIHKGVESGSMKWLQFYAFFGGNFKSFNKNGERPLDIALKKANVEIVLYVISQSQELLDDQNIFNQVFHYLERQILDQKITKAQLQLKIYKTILQKLIRIGTDRNKNVQVFLEMMEPKSFVFPNDGCDIDITITSHL